MKTEDWEREIFENKCADCGESGRFGKYCGVCGKVNENFHGPMFQKITGQPLVQAEMNRPKTHVNFKQTHEAEDSVGARYCIACGVDMTE